jgi:hypothetical protein
MTKAGLAGLAYRGLTNAITCEGAPAPISRKNGPWQGELSSAPVVPQLASRLMLDGAKKAWTRKPRDIPNGVSRSMLAKSLPGAESSWCGKRDSRTYSPPGPKTRCAKPPCFKTLSTKTFSRRSLTRPGTLR